MSLPVTYIFGEFRLDTARRLLFNGDEITRLPERAFQLLLLLLDARGEIVSKETLISEAWPDSIVSDANLSQHIYLLRRMLRERASDRSYIVMVPRKGFRFAVPVTVADTCEAPRSIEVKPDPFWEYCRGSQLLERRTGPQLLSAIGAFENAIRLDERCAPSYVGLARSYSLLAQLGCLAPTAAFEKVRTAIGHAINIDPRSAAAYAAFSEALLFGDWDWYGARGACEHALRLDPGLTFARENAVRLSIALGDYARARTEAQRVIMLDPSSAQLQVLFAQAMVHAEAHDQAISFLSRLIELRPGFNVARRCRAAAFLLREAPERAIDDLEFLMLEGDATNTDVALLSRAYAANGDVDCARRLHAKLLEMASTQYVVSADIALSAMGIGEEREAMRHLESAYRDREPALIFLKGLPWFEPLRGTPGLAQLLANVGPKGNHHGSPQASYGLHNLEDSNARAFFSVV
jgi:DNA-binding winged helix-turn-helix (wHTH) protein/Flp pilus assembly protein TadD